MSSAQKVEAMNLFPQPLSAQEFMEYGDVIGTDNKQPRTINYGNTQKFEELAEIDVDDKNGNPSLHIYHAQPLPLPHSIEVMECHSLGSQLFYPLDKQDYLIVVAKKGEFKPENIRCFHVRGDQGVNYRPGTWHHYCFSLGQTSRFLVVDRTSPVADCVEVHIPKHEIVINAPSVSTE